MDTKPNLHIANLADHPAWIPLLARRHMDEWGRHDPPGSLETWTTRLAARTYRDRIPMTFVAILDGEPAGTASLIENDMATRNHLLPWLAGVYVLREHRGKGTGAALVRHAEKAAADLGFERIYLYSRSAVGLYAKLGWVELERCAYEGREVAVMFKDL